MSTLPERGTPPPSVIKSDQFLSSILDDNNIEDTDDTDVVVFKNDNSKKTKSKKQIVQTVVPTPEKVHIKKETVKLENDTILFEFSVSDFCETELALIFVLSPDDFRITPKKDSGFTLTFRANDYPVYYIGGPVYFSRYNLHQIIFIKNLDAEE